MVRVQPMMYQFDQIHCYDHLARTSSGKINIDELASSAGSFSELMIVDVLNEGKPNSFAEEILSAFDHQKMQLICFGGISTKNQVSTLLKYENVSAVVAIGNSLSYREIANRSVLVQTENRCSQIDFIWRANRWSERMVERMCTVSIYFQPRVGYCF